MTADSYVLLGLALSVLLFGTVFLELSKAVLQSLDESDIKSLKAKNAVKLNRIMALLAEWPTVVTALNFGLFCGMMAVIFLVSQFSEHLSRMFPVSFSFLSGTVYVLFVVIFLLADYLLKPLLLRFSVSLTAVVGPLVFWYMKFLRPVVYFKRSIQKLIFRGEEINTANRHVGYEIMTGMARGDHSGNLEENEREMIHSILEFGQTEVHEIMVPRTDIVSADEESTIAEVTKQMEENGHSRLPLFHEDIDHILGVVHIKDLMPFVLSPTQKPLREIARPAHFVPETKKLHHLLKEFQLEKHHMAIVVDEYGGTAGLVTLEDVLEEIVGDIQDEYDLEPPLYQKIDEHTYSVNAKIDLHELNENLNLNLPTEGEYDSLGGFILSLTGYVPAQNEVVKYQNITFMVEKITRNRIIRIKLSRQETVAKTSGDANQDMRNSSQTIES